MQAVIELPTERSSEIFASRLALCLVSPLVLTFKGDIGAGKTTIIRAMLRHLGVSSAIKSPTFSLVESYNIANFYIHHFDLYRIHDEAELEYFGFRDYLGDNTICCIEWPERAKNYQSLADIEFNLNLKKDGREMQIFALSSVGETIVSRLIESA